LGKVSKTSKSLIYALTSVIGFYASSYLAGLVYALLGSKPDSNVALYVLLVPIGALGFLIWAAWSYDLILAIASLLTVLWLLWSPMLKLKKEWTTTLPFFLFLGEIIYGVWPRPNEYPYGRAFLPFALLLVSFVYVGLRLVIRKIRDQRNSSRHSVEVDTVEESIG
jgi:TRAP-type C4-dicarboxylate transport system permease small subunit